VTISVTKVQHNARTAGNLPIVETSISADDAVSGIILEFTVGALTAAPTVVNVVGLLGGEDIAAEIAGNTHYDVNAGALAKKFIGNLTFDFSGKLMNRLVIKPGTVIGAVTFPAVLPPNLAFVFNDEAIKITKVNATRKYNRMGG
jgi:hypothetical protein